MAAKQKKPEHEIPKPQRQPKADPSKGSYADGAEFDRVTYLEAKLILKPERFTSVQSFRDFGKLVKRAAKKAGVGFIDSAAANLKPQIREIVFLDTPQFALYSNAFILRRRISYVDGFPFGEPEIVFKFRHPDEERAAAVDMRAKGEGLRRIKFKAELLPLKDKIGGYRILYSHNCQFELSEVDNASMASLGQKFPVLATLQQSAGERLCW